MSPRTARNTNRALWTLQVLVAGLFLFAGAVKFMLPVEQLQQGPVQLPIPFLYFIGACECLGALGLVLPSALRVRTVLTPLAALGLTIIMIGATEVSILAAGSVAAGAFPAFVGIVTACIAFGRARVAPITESRSRALRFA